MAKEHHKKLHLQQMGGWPPSFVVKAFTVDKKIN